MSIALFDEPPRITFSQPDAVGGSRNGLLVGVGEEKGVVFGIVCLEDGTLTRAWANLFTIDYRYDPETDRWVDQNDQKPDREG